MMAAFDIDIASKPRHDFLTKDMLQLSPTRREREGGGERNHLCIAEDFIVTESCHVALSERQPNPESAHSLTKVAAFFAQ
jgi:hypothetical protein